MTVPGWAQDSIFYQIFPDRFENGDRSNDPINVRPWGSPPDSIHFQGGDLRGILERLDYLTELGVQAIYLNPIFLSPSNHRYNTVDYYQIDPKLGTIADFEALLQAVHSKDMHLVLDGVFNHCGRGFFAFNDILENGRESPYLDWYFVHRFPLDAYSSSQVRNYQGWWGHRSLPKFNTRNQKVREYLFNVARYWIEKGADGWRLDVPNEIDDDSFWAEFRGIVKGINPDALLIGEIWDVQSRWVGDQHFDGLMNYPFRNAILDLLQGGKSGAQTADAFRRIVSAYPFENLLSMYNLLGSHDTERIKTMLAGRADALRLAYLLLFALPGAPAIYYGDEIGLSGGKDPDCRAPFIWDDRRWDNDLREWIKMLIRIRKQQSSLRRGGFEIVYADAATPVIGFVRLYDQEMVLAVVNAASVSQHLEIRPAVHLAGSEIILEDLMGQQVTAVLKDGMITVDLPPSSGAYFRAG